MNPWDKYVVPHLVGCACGMKPIMQQRELIVPQASGQVLEIGCGTGTNFRFYDGNKVDHLYALEPSEGMLRMARRTAGALGIGHHIEFLETGAEAIPLDDNSIDTAVFTFVLCTIPNWEAALSEVRRVLKPDGKILFAEHGLSPDKDIAIWQRRIEPIWKPVLGGCHLTRDTEAMFAAAGFRLDGAQTLYLPGSPRFAGYVSRGSAVPV